MNVWGTTEGGDLSMASVLDAGGSLSREAPSGPLANRLGKQSWGWGTLGGVQSQVSCSLQDPQTALQRGWGLRDHTSPIHSKPHKFNSPQPQPRLESPRWPHGLPKDKSHFSMPRLLPGSTDLSPMCRRQEELRTFVPECTLCSAGHRLRDQSCRLTLGSGSRHSQDLSFQHPRKLCPSSAHTE